MTETQLGLCSRGGVIVDKSLFVTVLLYDHHTIGKKDEKGMVGYLWMKLGKGNL